LNQDKEKEWAVDVIITDKRKHPHIHKHSRVLTSPYIHKNKQQQKNMNPLRDDRNIAKGKINNVQQHVKRVEGRN
jgi:hypothetical protein